MNFLLDTHTWIWATSAPNRLGNNARNTFLDKGNTFYISSISALEVAQLNWGKRITLPLPVDEWVSQSMTHLHLKRIELTLEVAIKAYALKEPFHRDPADRILVSTALLHNFVLFTADKRLLDYTPLETRDCRQ